MEGRWNSTLHPTNSFAMDFSDWNDTHPCVCVYYLLCLFLSLLFCSRCWPLCFVCVLTSRVYRQYRRGRAFFLFSAWRERDYLLDSGDPQKELHREWASNKGKSGGGKFQNERKGFLHITFFFFFRIDKTPDTIVCTRTSRYGTILRLPIFFGIPAFVSVFFGYSSTLLVFTWTTSIPPQSIVNKRTRRGTWQKLIASFKV